MRSWIVGLALAAAVIVPSWAVQAAGDPGWPTYGGDQGGQRFSPANQITPANVKNLKVAWTFSTGDMTTHADAMHRASFENTPILAEGKLYVCSPFNEVSAIDPGSGYVFWRFDPKLNADMHYPNDFICRGVAFASNLGAPNTLCATRIYLNTADRRLIALDARNGKLCPGFGKNGTVVIGEGPQTEGPHNRYGRIHTTSAPVVSHGVVIVGSSIDDNQKVDELRGTVYAYDAKTGALKWSFDPLAGSPKGYRAGAANVWAPMSIDEQRGLVFLPCTSASPDFFGGLRRGSGKYANSIVALHVADGTVAWSFQTTHHDVWDYDLPAQPTLGMVTYNGKTVPAVLQPTKQGLLFTINRDTGAPIIPVVERKVPQDPAAGDQLSPTQPIPIAPAPLAPSHITPDDAFGLTFWDRGRCHDMIAAARNDGLYTPPSARGTIIYPFTGGGSNWGGIAFDPAHDVVYANTMNVMHLVTLIPRREFTAARERFFDKEVSPNTGAPFGMMRQTMLGPLGVPCNPPPWGQLHAIDMHTGKILWSVPLGSMGSIADWLLGSAGVPNLGGPIVTAGGLVFIGATLDNHIRAFDAKTGAELWKADLPAGGQATPMTYMWKGKQYVVIAAGGH
ncbi:MAG: pyrroloquinoline quinone-dependent dehydrogenase, partial [Alphaproteobacteria bacterium]|nr:pyrroloquinoline quinone-dependent dehydrogenase [Alphaproteobacteria bacterium]